jgi:hypothetical protein
VSASGIASTQDVGAGDPLRRSGGVAVSGGFGPGAVLGGRYRLVERIGRGGMADGFRGDDEMLGRPVAVKATIGKHKGGHGHGGGGDGGD